MIEKLNQLDEEYRERTQGIGGNYQKQSCQWQGCQLEAIAHGLCRYHYTQLTRGTLVKIDFSDLTHEAAASLCLEFQEMAEFFNKTPGQLLKMGFTTALKEWRRTQK